MINQKIKRFNDLVSLIMSSIKKGDDKQARLIFDKELRPNFGEAVWIGSSPLRPLAFFYCEMDDYLNNEGAKILGVSSKGKILDLYESEYKEEFAKLAGD